MELTARIVTLQLAETFTISRGSQDEAEVVEVEVTHDGQSGFGEAAPIDQYNESAQSALAYVEAHADALGDDPFALDEIEDRLPREEFAARAAINAALYDLQGKVTGLPVYRLLGLRRAGPPTTWTIWLGDPDDMARRAEKISAQNRFKRLKLKVGGRDGLDVERVRAVQAVTNVPLQVDVNEYWTLDEALEYLPQMEIEYCEQPLPAGSEDGPELKRKSPVPIYVDEDCHTLDDVAMCAERAHGINIKLAKSGGIREGVRMAHAARARPRRDARLHDRVRARHRRGRAHGVALRPRRPRREPPHRGRPVAGPRLRRRRPTSLRRAGARCQTRGT